MAERKIVTPPTFGGRARRAYIALMMAIVGRGLAIASRRDPVSRALCAELPEGLVVVLRVRPGGPALALQRVADGLAYAGGDAVAGAGLDIVFKHLRHAWLLYTFQENTPVAFAHDRMIVNGEVVHGAVFTRLLNRLLALILPRPVARRALKRYPRLPLGEKLRRAARIYLSLPFEATRAPQ